MAEAETSRSGTLPRGMLLLIGPGLLTAATGVGAGDLSTAGIAGSELGVAILWAVVLGAFLKFVLTEGLARWQLATGQTILEGAIKCLGPAASIVFIVYLLPWTFFTCAALMSACGVTASAILPVLAKTEHDILLYGALHSAVGVVLVWIGGYRLIEKLMAVCVGVMFVTVVMTAILLRPDLVAIVRGLTVPTIPDLQGTGLTWTVGLMGGVGGTLTIICYGYWIRERGRETTESLRLCRIDIAIGYAMTALFGIAMVIISTGMTLDERGSRLIIELSARLETQLGPAGKWTFLLGAWAAVFSSLLGVWQAVPYIFADFLAMQKSRHSRHQSDEAASTGEAVHFVANTRGLIYRGYLLLMATIPLLQIVRPFRTVQQYYVIMGAAFIPLLAVVLLVLNGKGAGIGRAHRNRPLTTIVLFLTLVLSILAAIVEVSRRFG